MTGSPCDRRWPRSAVALLATLLLAGSSSLAADSGVTIRAFAGAGYLLDSTERPGAWSARSMFDFTGGASVSGGFVRPQLLNWSGNFSYLGNRQVVQGGSANALDGFLFSARAGLLSGTPTPLRVYASRSSSDSTQTAPRQSAGTVITTGFGGGAAVSFLEFPRLTANLSRTIVDTSFSDGRAYTSGLTTLDVGVSQQVKRFEYSGAYVTNWSSGSFSDLQYGSHNVVMRAAAPVGQTAQFVVNEAYFVRLPTVDSPTNPRYETNAVNTLISWRQSPKLSVNLGYGNLQSSVFAPSTLDLANSSHGVNESLQWRWREDLILTQQLGGQFAAGRSAFDQFVGGRGDLGAGLIWMKPTSWGGASLGGGGAFGVAGDDASGVVPTWGAHVDLQASLRRGRLTGSGVYSLVYGDTGTRLFGSTIRQNLRLEAIYVPAAWWRLRAFFAGYGGRRDNALIGTSLQRSLQAVAEAGYRQHQLQLFATYGDGLPESLGNPVIADGLFLPAPFNAQVTNVGATASTSFFTGRLVLRATGRYMLTSGPARPTEEELGFTFTGAWVIGKFRFSAEDRLLLGNAGAFWYRNNTLMLRLTRDFDWSF